MSSGEPPFLGALLDLVPLGAHLLEAVGETPDTLMLRAANRAAGEQVGFDLRAFVDRPVDEAFGADPAFTALLHARALDQTAFAGERHYLDDRLEGWFRFWVRPTGGRRLLVLYEDITERKRQDERLLESDQLSRAIVEHLSEGVVVVDGDGIVALVNPAVSRICHVDASGLVGKHVSEFPIASALDANGQRLTAADTPAVRALAGEAVRGRLLQITRLDGTRGWAEVDSRPLTVPGHDRPRGAVSTYADVTEREERERRVRHEADHDALTGLANRRALDRALAATVARARASSHRVAVLVLDLDAFKALNDRFGHAQGDRALREVARRLRETVRERDIVARIGGDEFVVVLPGLAGPETTEEGLRERIEAVLREPFGVPGAAVTLAAAIGLARFPDPATDARDLLERADREMYARKRGREDAQA